MASDVTLDGNTNQSVQVDVTPLDASGAPTTDVGTHPVPTWTVDTPGALVIGPNLNGTDLPWQFIVSLPAPPVAGTFTTTATSDTITTVGTVTVNYSRPMTQMSLSFGTPTP